MSQLEEATVDELLIELKSRFQSFVFIGLKGPHGGKALIHEDVDMRFYGGFTSCVGLIERFRYSMLRDSERNLERREIHEDQEDDEELG